MSREKVLPACAGVILTLTFETMDLFRFTRMRGGDPGLQIDATPEQMFYPHARG